jgi:hypothetical protein
VVDRGRRRWTEMRIKIAAAVAIAEPVGTAELD